MSAADDLAAFLGERYDEAEALAKAWESPPWGEDATNWQVVGQRHPRYDNGRDETLTVIDVSGRAVNWAEAIQVRWDSNGERAAFIAANDPAHRLGDIALKRAILALHATETTREQRHALEEDIAAGKSLWWYEDVHSCVLCGWFDGDAGGCATVRQLGTEFSGHPAYRREWAP